MVERHKTREVRLGRWIIGGNNPIRVQSLTVSKTSDVAAALAEIKPLEEAGCEIVRVAVFDIADAQALGAIKKQMRVPLVADIHFNYKFALIALDQGVDKVRLNPGNIAGLSGTFNKEGRARVREVALKAKNLGIPMRVGVNSGSVEKDLLEKHGYPTAAAMVESALRHCEFLESLGFRDIIVSIKASDTAKMIENYRRFAAQSDIPTHLGVTEAGPQPYGGIKSSIGIGALLLEGIGDTIRVSLTGSKVEEVQVAFDILKATGRRVTSPEIVACPECGRIAIDLKTVVGQVKERIKDVTAPITISILGCAVNGPGEAREADIGVAGERGKGLIFRKGVEIRRVSEEQMVDALEEEVRRLAAEMEQGAPEPKSAAASKFSV
jgi:(E)-4-hydroxy-3-methylbut-2-enyl-diphosphate synthase